ncbi:prepilin-type cleavage/methylation domain-containing protein [Neorhodopirellula lusitana]|nr:prepilin-type cleavage/methylation domain-containing protein [Neorhodopirellula lusitana]
MPSNHLTKPTLAGPQPQAGSSIPSMVATLLETKTSLSPFALRGSSTAMRIQPQLPRFATKLSRKESTVRDTGSVQTSPTRSAFTLLEMLLSLSMCVVLMTLVSSAMTFYVRDMGTAEATFRDSQIATAVLQMIEDDIRMSITTRPVSTDELAGILEAAASPLEGLTDSLDSGADSGIAGAEDLPEDTDLLDSEISSTVDLTVGGTVLQSPGLIGSDTQLQIDTSRLPRLEDTVLDPSLSADGNQLQDRPSDIKTVTYFVSMAGSGMGNDALAQLADDNGITIDENDEEPSLTGGLVRRQIDRAIHSHASLTGGLARLQSVGEILAPEIVAINFEYYDGINWLPYFNSDEYGYLPMAIRVQLQMNGDEGQEARTFTHVIYLPMSHPEDAEDDLDATTETTTTETSTSAF